MKPERLTIKKLEKVSGLPADEWHGKCADIAHVACNLVGGDEIYGIYNGFVDEDGYWGSKALCRHGWVLLEDGRILDPTRWSFENTEPYIFIGKPGDPTGDGEYDEGTQDLRARVTRPCPEPKGDPLDLDIDPPNQLAIEQLTQTPIAKVTRDQMFWIANLPYDQLGMFVHSAYNVLIENEMGVFIPIDNKKRAIREGRLQA